MPRTSQQDFLLWNSPKFILKKEIFPNSLPFFVFCPGNLTLRRIFAHRKQNSRTFFGYSVVKYRKKQKGAATFKSLSRTFASPLLKQFWIYFTNPLNFRVSGAETNRSRFSKSFWSCGLNRRVSADNSDYQNPHTIRPTDFCLTASQYLRRSQSFLRLYVSNFESLKLSPVKFCPNCCRTVESFSTLQKRLSSIFLKIFFETRKFVKNDESLSAAKSRIFRRG